MENTLLWQTLAQFEPLELKHFQQWLDSPFFCRKTSPGKLYAYLRRCLKSGSKPTKEGGWRAFAVKGTPLDVVQLRLVTSEVLEQAEQFLIYSVYFSQTARLPMALASAYRKRGLEKHFHRSLKEARQKWDEQAYRHSEYYEAQAEIEYEQYQYQSANNRTEELNLQVLLDHTDIAILSRKLRQACFALTHQAVYKTEYDLGLVGPVIDYLEQKKELLEYAVLALYYQCYRFLTEPANEAHFYQFKNLLLQKAGQLPPDEQRDLHLLAINYCIKKINQLQTVYFRESLDLYQSALERELLFENGNLSPFAFNNIVAIALKVGDIDWAETFIHAYADRLEKKHRAANLQLNLARVAYVRKDFRQALLNLQEADYKDRINNLIAKTLQMKIFFETEEYDLLEAHLQSMQTYIRRQRVIGYHKTNFLNIIRFTKKLTHLTPGNRKEHLELQSKIEATQPLTEKEWLLEMLG
ncbi:MAG: hypothetical protein R2792_05445 [Saprospiraceae bacterium]